MITDRKSSPDAAFAYVGKIGERTFKLLHHHDLNSVRDGTEHDTVDAQLLVACIRMLAQLPVDDETREKIRQHLMTHANEMRLDIDENVARRFINQQAGGPSGNEELTQLGTKKLHPEDPQLGPNDVAAPKAAKMPSGTPTEGNEDANSNSPDVVHVDNGEQVVHQDPQAEPKSLSAEDESEDAKKKADSVDTETKRERVKRKGKEGVKKDSKVKGQKKTKTPGPSVYSGLSSGDIVTFANKIAIVTKASQFNANIRFPSGKTRVNQDPKTLKVICKNTHGSVDDCKGLQILNSIDAVNNALANIDKIVKPVGKGLPKDANEEKSKPKVVHVDNGETLVENPNKDKMGKQSLIVDADSVSRHGKSVIIAMFNKAIKRSTAKIQSVEKLGSVDFMSVVLGEDSDFPVTLMVDVARNGDGKVSRLRVLNESIPGEALADFSKFLKDLSKSESKATS